ncbi:unnamed protein product [Debaryomyces tyrocola]|nr:unnamed protein product [Debaryomyces tyrocola]
MVYEVLKLAQFPNYTVLIFLFTDVDTPVLKQVKEQLISGNKDYDFCFLNPQHIISLEHLYSSIHKAVLNYEFGNMRAKTLNTEIIFNLSPINNIMDALKRFGVDEACPNLITIKVLPTSECNEIAYKELNNRLLKILNTDASHNPKLNNEIIFDSLVDVKKLKKVYKLNDAKFSKDESGLQGELTRLAIGACQLRGC